MSLSISPHLADALGMQTRFPFNVGILTNVTSVLGHTPFEWLFGGGGLSDGLSFPHLPGTGSCLHIQIARAQLTVVSCRSAPLAATRPVRQPQGGLEPGSSSAAIKLSAVPSFVLCSRSSGG